MAAEQVEVHRAQPDQQHSRYHQFRFARDRTAFARVRCIAYQRQKSIGEKKAENIVEYRRENGEFEDRSQLKNKSIVTKRFLELIKNALVIPKIRKATKIPKSVIRKRIKDKKNVSEIKQNRRKPTHD